MGNINNKDIENYNSEPIPVHICYYTKKYNNKPNCFVTYDKYKLFNLDSEIFPKYSDIYYKSSDEIIIGISKSLENAKNLYYIQNGNDFIEFKNMDIVSADNNLAHVLKIPIEEISKVNMLEFNFPAEDFKGTLREYIKSEYSKYGLSYSFLDDLKGYIFPILPDKDSPFNKMNVRSIVNRWSGYSYKDFTFPTNNLYFIHNTYDFDKIKKSKFLCSLGICNSTNFIESTGFYVNKDLIKPREMIQEQPGIYFTHFKYPEYMLKKDSLFRLLDYYSIYGNIGFIFNVEEIFKKYKVNLKKDQNFGYGQENDIISYFKINGDEAIVRANKIPLSMIKAIRITFGYSELRFIYENFPEDNFSLNDVVNLYKKNRNKHWYIRKSGLLKIVDSYKKDIPLIIASKHIYDDIEVYNYGTEFDIDSDPELMD